jgi:hypothetical protein
MKGLLRELTAKLEMRVEAGITVWRQSYITVHRVYTGVLASLRKNINPPVKQPVLGAGH